MNQEKIFETFTRKVCNNCKNKKVCQEELRIKIDNSIKCDKYEPIELGEKKIIKMKDINWGAI